MTAFETLNRYIAEDILKGHKYGTSGYYSIGALNKGKIHFSELDFHHNWKSLMKVVEVIEATGYEVHIIGTYCKIVTKPEGKLIVSDYEEAGTEEDKIMAVYFAITKFTNYLKDNTIAELTQRLNQLQNNV